VNRKLVNYKSRVVFMKVETCNDGFLENNSKDFV
jgi:hypothetical protein